MLLTMIVKYLLILKKKKTFLEETTRKELKIDLKLIKHQIRVIFFPFIFMVFDLFIRTPFTLAVKFNLAYFYLFIFNFSPCGLQPNM